MLTWDHTAQSAASEALRTAVARDEVGHAFVLVGPQGVGQREIARVLTAALNCDNPSDGNPCQVCATCNRVQRDSHSALVTFEPEGANHLVASVRDEWIHTASRTMSEGRRRIIRIVAADRMNESAQNSFLKALEEPPPSTVWLLEVEDDQAMLDTILSRCRRLDMVTWGPQDLLARAALLDVPEERRSALVRAATGSPDRLAALASRECPECGRVLAVGADLTVPAWCREHPCTCSQCGETFKGPPKLRRGKPPCGCAPDVFDPELTEGVRTIPDTARGRHLDVIRRLAEEGPGAATAVVRDVLSWAQKSSQALDDAHERHLLRLAEDHGVEDVSDVPKAVVRRLQARHKRAQRDLRAAGYHRFLDEFGSYLRDLLLLQSGGDAADVVNLDHLDELQRDLNRIVPSGAIRALSDIARCREALGEFNGQPELQLERVMHPVAAAVFAAGRAA